MKEPNDYDTFTLADNLDYLLPEKGFNIAQALVDSEGSCITILSATIRLQHYFPERVLVVLGYPSPYEAGDHVMEIMAHRPTGCEGIDNKLIEQVITHSTLRNMLIASGVSIVAAGAYVWLKQKNRTTLFR